MKRHQQSIPDSIGRSKDLNASERKAISKTVGKLEVELAAKSRDLEIESSLERVRAVALRMKTRDDMLEVCRVISEQMEILGVKDIRNVQTAIFYEAKGNYMNYEYYARHRKTFITEVSYTRNKLHKEFAVQMLKGKGKFYSTHIKAKKLKDWIAYQKTTNVFVDKYLEKALSLNYYFYSLGPVVLGISTYSPLNEKGSDLFKRFLKVFELSYRRYLDIEKAEAQAREAKIEASLEKVRAIAMSMSKPGDLLNICETLFKEFNAFGFADIRNAMINIHNDDNKTFVNYDYSDAIGKSTNQLLYDIHPVIEKQVKQMRSANDAFSETVFSGKDLIAWKKFRNKIGEKDDPRINKAKSLYYYFYSIGTGSIGISTFSPVGEEKLKLLKRFRNVFNLSYQRYLDIALAEAQAKEARIETALERVRAVAMAMRKPRDLSGISETLFTELKALGFADLRNSEIIINNDKKETITSYYYSDYGRTGVIELDYRTNPTVQGWMNDLRKADDAFVEVIITEKEIPAWKKYMDEIGYLPDIKLKKARPIYYYSYSIGLGALSVSSFTIVAKEQIKILERFRNVFQLSYQRYADIAQAEAQSREAQIELALERVRARTMAMQKSDELPETSLVLFQQLKDLGEPADQLSIGIMNEAENIVEVSLTLHGKPLHHVFRHSMDEPILMNKIYKSWKKRQRSLVVEIKGAELETYNQYRNDLIGSEVFTKDQHIHDRRVVHSAFFTKGMLALATDEIRPAESLQLLERFAKVFDGTYTRFLDLKKAEAQSREAQVELALERVRAKTMAMQKSGELSDTAAVLFQEFKKLGEEDLLQITIGIYDETKGLIAFNVTSWAGGGKPESRSFNMSIEEPTLLKPVFSAWKEQKKSIVVDLKGKELEGWVKYRNAHSGVTIRSGDTSGRRVVSVAFFSKGHISFSSPEPKSPETIQLLERFAAVFDQTYTRFLDLQKAEAQARESQIQLALERVRARTMAMQQSDEILDTAAVLFKQFNELGSTTAQVSILVFDEEVKKGEMYFATEEEKIGRALHIELDRDEFVLKKIKQAFLRQEKSFSITITGKELQKYNHWRNEFAGEKRWDESKAVLKQAWHVFVVFFPRGMIGFSSGNPILTETKVILERFVSVFEQTYTRFLDLQKAEAQAREAQIEAALERVRSRSMGMQKSEELKEVIRVVYDQFVHLNIHVEHTGFIMDYKARDDMHIWLADRHEVPFQVTIPYFDSAHWNSFNEAKEKGMDFFANHLSFEEKNKFYQDLFKLIPGVPEETLEYYFSCPGLAISTVLLENVGLYIENFSGIPYSDEENKTLMRFGKVFQQTYTRFSDLKQAEAQARESQVELALERVRARTMAMQHSDELKDASALLFQQVHSLGMPAWSAGYCIWDEDKKAITAWMNSEGVMQNPFKVPLIRDPTFIHFLEAHQRGETLFVEEVSDNELKKHYKYMLTLPVVGENLSALIEAGFKLPTFQINHCAYFSKGFLLFITYEQVPDAHDIFKRFAKVFDQTYTRFLDLQKAEAQSREAQVELALERVRAKTMAMQRSDELKDAAALLFQQVKALGVPVYSCGYNIWEKDEKEFTSWMSSQDGSDVNGIPNIPLTEDANFIRYVESKQKDELFFVLELRGERMQEHYKYLKMIPAFKGYFDYAVSVGFELPETQIHHLANFTQGNLLFITLEPCPQFHDVFKRFAAVFDQTYTRFLDLQKAEAQSRESQVQLALERVRARTMAMQKSDELSETVFILFQQFKELGENPEQATIGIINEEEHVIELSLTMHGSKMNQVIKASIDEPIVINKLYNAWKNQNKSLVIDISGKELLQYNNFRNKIGGSNVINIHEEKRRFIQTAFFTKGLITISTHEPRPKETTRLLERFASVFDGTYTRFLDLQKAEAQSREAQIELGLERVRARAMAMQKSDELSELVDTVFKELTKLDFALTWCMINVIDESTLSNTVWTINSEAGKIPESFHMKFEDYPFHHAMMKGWKERKTKDVYVLEGQEKKIYDEYLFNETEFKRTPEAAQAASRAMEKYVVTFSFSNFGGLQTVGDAPLSDSNLDILSRFGKVFDLTYTRFNDLQKAEAQAKEAKIELSLERVRARTMAMHNSEELVETSALLFHELKTLSIETIRTGFAIMNEQKQTAEIWSWQLIQGKENRVLGIVPINIHPFFQGYYKSWKRKDPFFSYRMVGDEVKKYYRVMSSIISYPEGVTYNPEETFYSFFFPEGSLNVISQKTFAESECNIMLRFARVFGLIYRRFLDLQKAEAQSRDAQIELALERVRAKTMAMHNSPDVGDTVATMFDELIKLGVKTNRCGILIYSDDPHAEVWTAIPNPGGKAVLIIGYLDLKVHALLDGAHKAWKNKDPFYIYDLIGDDLVKYYEAINNAKFYPHSFNIETLPSKEFHSDFYFPEGSIFAFTNEPVETESALIFKRFAGVFGQTYRRYLDLQKAEVQAREAQIEASLERVRAKAMAMHNSADLSEAAGALFTELNKLGINPIRSGFVLLTNKSRKAKLFPATSFDKGNTISFTGEFEFVGHAVFEKQYESWQKKENYFPVLDGEELTSYYKILSDGLSVPYYNFPTAKKQFGSFLPFTDGFLFTWSDETYSENEINILNRFKSILELTLRRYFDLQKAEEQTREAQIELALERVRARTMAMHKSEEFMEVINLVSEQLQVLNITIHIAGFSLDYKAHPFNIWMAAPGQPYPSNIDVPYREIPMMQRIKRATESGLDFYSDTFSFEEKNQWLDNVLENTIIKYATEERKKFMLNAIGLSITIVMQRQIALMMGNYAAIPYTDAENAILKRFSMVFEQTYTRFLDLQKAEAQAREAQVEAALERVRSKAMAMHKSDDFNPAVATVFDELEKLNPGMKRCGIAILSKENRSADIWTTSISDQGATLQTSGDESIDIHPLLQGAFDAWLTQNDFAYQLQGDDLIGYYQALDKTNFRLPKEHKVASQGQTAQQFYYVTPFEAGNLFAFRETDFPDEAKKVMRRFAGVFNLTYKRFLDIQKAEAQAREAQVEAGLERVRAVAMSMMKSDELLKVCESVFKQLKYLGSAELRNAQIYINYDDKGKFLNYNYSDDTGSEIVEVFYDSHPNVYEFYKKLKESSEAFADYEISGAQLDEWKFYLNNTLGQKRDEKLETATELHYYFYSVGTGALGICTFKPIRDEELKILKRFRNVFNLSYQRYTDIALAEAQAREAKIEAGLERVRSRTLAMQKSYELAETAAVVFKQLINLGIEPNRLYIAIIKDESGNIEFWITDEDGSKVSTQFTGNKNRNLSIQKMYDGWAEQKKSISMDMQGKELEDYFHYLSEELKVPFKAGLTQKRRAQTIAYFSRGFIGIASPDPQPAETTHLLERFAYVFNLTYTRFNDLQLAEAQTREAKIEGALERVRARALAMQAPEELKDVAQVLRSEMGILGVEELETCSIYLHDDNSENAECWFAIKDSKYNENKMVTDHFELNLNDTWVGREMLKFYKSSKKKTSIMMKGADRREWIHYCEQFAVHLRGFYGENIPDRAYHLYKFSHGTIGAATPGDISEESWSLLKRAASVFSLAYSRFKDLTQARVDLQNLIEEKKRAEDALKDLKATQTQLIQSEKMASLGELTAGIAHEIQNPLNFVNNFSEVNTELIAEMREEIVKGNLEDVKAIANDISDNEQKINHHGKRAEAIVKGMLQHSRSSSGIKEPTNINALADEYLRLAYHGLRAKDKTFNASMKTDYDESIGNINVIPQDIGRVILNLITNAFYVVAEKKNVSTNSAAQSYEPIVSVSTKKIGNKVLISVKDNGNGIPHKVLDKIFQPFFTTKPTGQGTGLGLSLSYDIVKAHGGEIKVDTKEGEGTEFIIQLPILQ